MHSFRSFLRRAVQSLALFSVWAAPAIAGVILVVDDDGGPGVDFTDIPLALEAAQSGDVLVIKGGNYSSFNVSEGVALLGETEQGPVAILGPTSRVSFLPSGQVAILRNLRPTGGLRIASCAGTVVLEDLLSSPTISEGVSIQSSLDVRAVRVTAAGATARSGVLLSAESRLELVRSSIQGGQGVALSTTQGGTGASAVLVVGNAPSRAHFVLTNLTGGTGGDYTGGCFLGGQMGGTGGNGLTLGPGFALASGLQQVVAGGAGGYGGSYCPDGYPGLAVFAQGLFQHSGIQFNGQVVGNAQQVVPPDPFLSDLAGEPPAPGATILVTVRGVPGDAVRLYLGRSPVVEPIPGVKIERLTSEDRGIELGTIGASGSIGWPFMLPASLPKGFCFFIQARILRAGSELRTNSIPVIIR